MIDPKFKDMLTLANMGVTPDALTAFENHRNKIQQGDDAVKMRNSVLFGNTFANPGSQTNATFIPPQPGSMYNNMVSPDDINNTRRDMIRTQANLAMTNNPINPMFNRPARPSGSALLNNVNANSAPLIFQNLDKNALLDNLEKTIEGKNSDQVKAERQAKFDKIKGLGLALQGKDPNAMDMKKIMQMLDLQYKGSLIEGQTNKKKDRQETIDFARSAVVSDASLDEAQRNLILSNDSAALVYGKTALKGKDPVNEIANYALTSTYSPSAFMYMKQNIDKFQDETLKDILRKTDYNQYISSDQRKNSFNSLLQSQVNVADPELMRFIEANSRNGSYVSQGERNAFNIIEQRRFRGQL